MYAQLHQRPRHTSTRPARVCAAQVSVRVVLLDDIRSEHHSAERAAASFRFGSYAHPASSSALGAPLALDPARRTAFAATAVAEATACELLESRGRWEVEGNNKGTREPSLTRVSLPLAKLSVASPRPHSPPHHLVCTQSGA
jgi:hypothetical protein